MSAAINNAERPVATVLLYAIDDDFTMYFATHRSTIKAKSLAIDPKISFSVWRNHEMLIQASGATREVTDSNQLESVLDKLAESTTTVEDFWPPILQVKGSDYVVYEIKIDWMRALDLSNVAIHNEQQFSQII